MTNFGKLLTKFGYTQTYLSKISGISQSNISIYSNYQRALEASSHLTRIKLAEAFKMTVEEFEKELEIKPATILATNKQFVNLGVE